VSLAWSLLKVVMVNHNPHDVDHGPLGVVTTVMNAPQPLSSERIIKSLEKQAISNS